MKKNFLNFFLIFSILYLFSIIVVSEDISFKLKTPVDGIYYHKGILSEPNERNQGLIANLGIIVGEKSILVVDAGPSKALANKFIKTIKKISDKPIKYLIITHRHFDHSYGMEAFKEINSKIYMSKKEFYAFKKYGPTIFNNLVKNRGFDKEGINFNNITLDDIFFLDGYEILDLGNRKVLIKNIGAAHSEGDLIVYDYKTKTYFVGDLIFRNRAAAFTDANILNWSEKINFLFEESWKFVIPGHGEIIRNKDELFDTSNWLKFLQKTIAKAKKNGDMISEILEYEVPETLEHLKLKKSTLKKGLKRKIEMLQ